MMLFKGNFFIGQGEYKYHILNFTICLDMYFYSKVYCKLYSLFEYHVQVSNSIYFFL
jgi:hypothetical protein